MIEDKLKNIAKRFTLFGGMSANANLWTSMFSLALALLVALSALQTGQATSWFSALFLAVIAMFNLQRAGFILLLAERTNIHSGSCNKITKGS